MFFYILFFTTFVVKFFIMKVDNIISNIFKFIIILHQEKNSYMSTDYRREIFNRFITKKDISELDINEFHIDVINGTITENNTIQKLINLIGVENLIDDDVVAHKIIEKRVEGIIEEKTQLYKIIRRKIILNNLV